MLLNLLPNPIGVYQPMDLHINEIFGFPLVKTVKSALGFPAAKVTGPSQLISEKPTYGGMLAALWLKFMMIPGWLSGHSGENAQGHHHLHGGLTGSTCMNYMER